MDKAKVAEFESLLLATKRPGIEKLLEFVRKSDFYTAPASTRFHSCHEGGLLEHSLNVYHCMMQKKNDPVWADILNEVGDESLTIASLLHDLCKAMYYVVEFKNKKVYSENGKKSDSNGRFDWQSVPGYTVDDKIPLGHGEKSCFMIEEFMRLKPVERYMIRWHMLFSESKDQYNTLGAALKRYPVILAISEADLESTYLLEKEE